MSAWDMGPFDNDTAEDLVLELADAPDIPQRLNAAMAAILNNPHYLDCPAVERALAAACLVGVGIGVNSPLPESVRELLAVRAIEVTPALRNTAARAFDRVQQEHNNEWYTVWTEDEQLEATIAAFDPYRRAVSHVPAGL